MPFLKISAIRKEEQGKGPILQNVSFIQDQFQNIAIAGETGSGKSTLLKIIAGLLQPDSGTVVLEEERVLGPQEQLVAGHSEIAYLSQHFELPEFLRVEQALQYANSLTPQEAAQLYQICQISHLLSRRTDELSGGEKQRIALARLLSTSPSLLLLDEPYSNLDLIHKNQLKAIVRNLGSQVGITCILISHDPQDTLSWADQILVIQGGQVVQKGTPQQVYNQPANAYVAGLFGKYTLLEPELAAAFSEIGQKRLSPFVRPEDFRITAEGNGLKGLVQRVAFYGGYEEAEIEMKDQTLLVKTEVGTVAEGAQVFIELREEKLDK